MKKGELVTLSNLVFSDTDFESIHCALIALNWTWISENTGEEYVPSVKNLKSKATEIMNAIIEQYSRIPKDGYFIKSSGGFTGSYYAELYPDKQKADTLNLTFDLSNVSLNYKDVVGQKEVDYGLKKINIDELAEEFTDLAEELKTESMQTQREIAKLKVDVQDLKRQVVDLRGQINADSTN